MENNNWNFEISRQFGNRTAVTENSKKIFIIEHYLDSDDERRKIENTIKKAVNSHEELVKALQDILTYWDKERGVPNGYPIEEIKEGMIGDEKHTYWSPHAAMVSSEYINAARLLLQKVNANT